MRTVLTEEEFCEKTQEVLDLFADMHPQDALGVLGHAVSIILSTAKNPSYATSIFLKHIENNPSLRGTKQ